MTINFKEKRCFITHVPVKKKEKNREPNLGLVGFTQNPKNPKPHKNEKVWFDLLCTEMHNLVEPWILGFAQGPRVLGFRVWC